MKEGLKPEGVEMNERKNAVDPDGVRGSVVSETMQHALESCRTS